MATSDPSTPVNSDVQPSLSGTTPGLLREEANFAFGSAGMLDGESELEQDDIDKARDDLREAGRWLERAADLIESQGKERDALREKAQRFVDMSVREFGPMNERGDKLDDFDKAEMDLQALLNGSHNSDQPNREET